MEKTDFLTGIINGALKVLERGANTTAADWCIKHIRLPRGQGTEQGFTAPDYNFAPDMPEVLEAIRDKEVRTITLCYASQCGKSLTLICYRAYRQEVHAADCLWVFPHGDTIERFVNRMKKIYTESILGYASGKRAHTKKRLVWDNGSDIVIGLASSPAQLAERPCPDVFFDELDENREINIDPQKLASDRQRNFPHTSKTVNACTPKFETKGSFYDYTRSKRYERYYQCPNCGEYQALEFENLKWEKSSNGTSPTPEIVRDEHLGYYLWPCCGHKSFDEDKFDISHTGRWECLDPEKSRRSIGFRKTAFDTNAENFSDIAAEFLDSRDKPEKLRNFFCSWMAAPKDLETHTVTTDKLRRLVSAEYNSFTIHSDVQRITIGADYGGSGFYYCVLGWGYSGEVFVLSVGVATGRSMADQFDSFSGTVTDWITKYPEKVSAVGIDSGYETNSIYSLCKGLPRTYPIKGDTRTLPGGWRKVHADPNRKSGSRAAGLVLYQLDTEFWQDTLQSYLSSENRIHFPEDIPGKFFMHLQNEVKRDVVEKRTNRTVQRWQKKTPSSPQHWRDALYYAIAIGSIAGCDAIRRPSDVAERTDLPQGVRPVQRRVRSLR